MSEPLRRTQSVCPVCLRRVEAAYHLRGEEVWLKKTCPDHGFFEALVWQGEGDFKKWQQEPPAQPPANPQRKAERGCPYDCGLCRKHRQASCCVLLEVTVRCNLGCPVCFASSEREAVGRTFPPDPDLKQIAGWYDMLLEKGGPFNIQLSGGEPTLRDDLPELIRLGVEKGFGFFQANTNGLRIARDPAYLRALCQAGLNTVFLQFDTLRAAPSIELRGADLRKEKEQAIENCARAGVGVVLAVTVKPACNDGELWEILSFAARHGEVVRGVHFQPISYFGRYDQLPAQRLTVPTLLEAMEAQSGGRIRATHFSPGGAEHPMCSFHADYTVEGEVWKQKERQNSCCCAGDAAQPTSQRARRAVALKWAAAPRTEVGSGYNVDSLDAFLQTRKRHSLAVSGMAFQDAWTLDLQRLQRCHVHVVSPLGELIPFCAYNLTAQDGTTLYR